MPDLVITDLSLHFGGIRALESFNFTLDAGQLVGLIGPNGAGKTTVFNIVTGVYRPTGGDVKLCGKSIIGLPPYRVNRRGIARTFQNIRLFGNLTVIENVLVGLHRDMTRGFWGTIFRSTRRESIERDYYDQAMEFLKTLGLADRASDSASQLPYGHQRRLEIARALATSPKILLLDEPAAGMNPREKAELMDLIRLIRDRYRLGIWLIEHDMKLVMNICQRITVLDHGEIIAEGTPQEVQSDEKVVKAYLGEPA